MSTNEYPLIFECAPFRPPLMMMERAIKWKPDNFELSPNCPRCGSSNTKFCYYNNHSLSQPRYFCKSCRRYWTKGGSLRKVPIGGGCRKTRRSRATRQDGGGYYLTPSDSGFMTPRNQSDTGREIDLAAEENDEASDKLVPASSSDVDTQMGDSNPVSGCAKSMDLINGRDDQLQRVDGYIDDQDFVYQNCNGFEVEGMFGSEVEADISWSEGMNFPSSGSELQDFEIFSGCDDDDQMRISANLASGN